MNRKTLLRIVVFGCGVAAGILAIRWYWSGESPAPVIRPTESPADGYAGSASCRSCHQQQFSTWHDSYHRTMTQPANEETVKGDFNNVRFSATDLDVRLFKQGGQFMAEMNFRNPTLNATYPVVLVTGSHYRQAYWMSNPDDKELVVLPYMYLLAEKRWIPRHSGYIGTRSELDAPERDQYKGEYGRWSVICIKCHTTHGQPMPPDESGHPSKVARVAEFGISCEACHGPGAAHVNARQKSADVVANGQTDVVDPARLDHKRSSDTCGQCHSVFTNRSPETYEKWLRNGDTFRPGNDVFADPQHYIIRGRLEQMPDRPAHVIPAASGAFWSDGMIRITGREFNGLIDSPCYQRGTMSCLSCHQMHEKENDPRPHKDWAVYQVTAGMETNRACTQCHNRFNQPTELKKHTHHLAESSGSNCYNCHMPYTTYGILKAARSHQITSPKVAVSIATGRPNACNQCHQDKTLSWTADKLAEWYKQPKPKLSGDDEKVAASVQWALTGDAAQRAIIAWSYGWKEAQQTSGTHWQAPYLAQLLNDPYDAVRFIAHRSLKQYPGFSDFEYDFVGPPEARAEAVQRARKIWEKSLTGTKHAVAPETLIDPAGRLMEADFRRLLRSRNNRPVEIAE
jgi:hypothetical protein